jgi:pimeloyl-ACP methyl ester carboxylesterase
VDFATTGELEIAYEVSGPKDGVPVVALHGWPDSPGTWNGTLASLNSGGCRVYRPYLRGFGPTRFRNEAAPRSGQIAALCRDLGEFVAALDLDGLVLAGHDWGARAACAVEPGPVAGLVAISVAYGSTGPQASVPLTQAQAYWYPWYFATPPGHRALADEPRRLCRYLWRQWSPSWDFTEEEFEATARAWSNPDWARVTAHSYAQRWGAAGGDPGLAGLEDRLAASPPIAVPTIVLHGTEDGGTLVEATADQDRYFTAGYERRVLAGVGHFVPRQAPDDVAAAILELADAAR